MSGVIRYSNEMRCFGTRCCEGPEAIAGRWAMGRGSKGEKTLPVSLFVTSPTVLKVRKGLYSIVLQ